MRIASPLVDREGKPPLETHLEDLLMADAALPVIVLSDSDPLRRHETAELVQSWYRTSFRVLQVGGPAEVVRALTSLADRKVPVAACSSGGCPRRTCGRPR